MRIVRVVFSAALFGAASLVVPIRQAPARAEGYQLDTSFGGRGYVEVNWDDADWHEGVDDLIVRDDGSVQFAGTAFYDPEEGPRSHWLAHLSTTGAPDPAFGPEGAHRLNGSFVEQAADGSFVVLRYTGGRELLTRYRQPGEVDTTFGTDGSVPFSFGGADPSPEIRARPDGGGWFVVGTGSIEGDFVVTKLNAAGAPDETFGPDGTLRTDLGGTEDTARTAALQADGKLLVAGIGGPDGDKRMAVARYTEEGLDPSFSGDGLAIAAVGQSLGPESIFVQPDGKIVVVGGTGDVALARFLPDGTPDLAFGTAGIVKTNLGGDEKGFEVVATPDGHLFVAGRQSSNGDHRGAGVVLRYSANGTLDSSFGTGGAVTALFSNELSSVAVDGDYVYVAGRAPHGNSPWVVARFGPIPEPATSTTTTTTSTGSSTTTTAQGASIPAPPTAPTTPDLTGAAPGGQGTATRRSGYWMVGADGTVYRFGDATWYGNAPVGSADAVDVEPSPSGNGYWIVDNAGRVFAFGDARWFGNLDTSRLRGGEQVTSLSARNPELGYLAFTSKGRVFAIGPDGQSEQPGVGHLTLNGPVLDSVVTPAGDGYYMVASDGGIFTFGDAVFRGSMGDRKLNAPVQSLVPDGDGDGYWLVASDGGIFAFRADFRGSLGAIRLNRPVTGMVRAGTGYLMVGEDGGIFDFSGDSTSFKGSLGANPPARPITAVALL